MKLENILNAQWANITVGEYAEYLQYKKLKKMKTETLKDERIEYVFVNSFDAPNNTVYCQSKL